MATKKQLQHVMDLAKRRKNINITPRALKHSDVAITDAARLKQEIEAKRAADLWTKGMAKERGK